MRSLFAGWSVGWAGEGNEQSDGSVHKRGSAKALNRTTIEDAVGCWPGKRLPSCGPCCIIYVSHCNASRRTTCVLMRCDFTNGSYYRYFEKKRSRILADIEAVTASLSPEPRSKYQ